MTDQFSGPKNYPIAIDDENFKSWILLNANNIDGERKSNYNYFEFLSKVANLIDNLAGNGQYPKRQQVGFGPTEEMGFGSVVL